MNAVHYLLLYLRRLSEALRRPLDTSLRRLLQLWALVKIRLFSKGVHRKSKNVLQREEENGQGSTIIYASNVPTQLSPIIGGNTPPLLSPAPRLLVSYEFPSSDAAGTSPGGAEESTDNHLGPHGYISDKPRPPSIASSRTPSMASFRNAHMGAEQSALRGLVEPHFIISSRSGSPISQRSIQFPNTYLGPNDFPLRPLFNSPANPRAHSMVDLHNRSYRASISGKSGLRARSSSPRPMSRARSRSHTPTTHSGDREHHNDAPGPMASPAHIAADPEFSLPCPPPTTTKSVIPKIQPCTTVGRYDRNVKIKPDEGQGHVIPLLTTSFAHENLPSGWTPLAHPEGALYWVHEDRPIYTDAYLCNIEAVTEINTFLDVINRFIEEADMPLDWELVLELTKDEETDERIWAYYFVNHETRTLFWLHDFDADMILSELRGVKSKSHIYHQLQSHYWTHWETFPHNREVPLELYQELMGILVHAGIDSLTSPVSTSVYSEADLQKLVRFIKMSKSVGGNYGYAACVTGRMMSFFANSRFLNFYGQECARLSRDQPVFDEEPRPRSALMLLSALLFFAPEVHLRGLEDTHRDRIVCAHTWSTFIGKLQGEWQEFILYATVLLNANVAFLAIPSVDNGSSNRTPSQIVSYISVVTSVGSIITGLLLIRQYRNKKEDASEVGAFLTMKSNATHGFETLAIMYSLPYSLLMWAMIAFLTAFLLECLLKPADVLARIPVIIAWSSVGALVLWCVGTGWDRRHPVRYPLKELVRGWLGPLWLEKQPGSTEDEHVAGTQQAQTPWVHRVLPLRSSTGSTLVGSAVENRVPRTENAV